jgi:hypothetical protein
MSVFVGVLLGAGRAAIAGYFGTTRRCMRKRQIVPAAPVAIAYTVYLGK